ncbi:hypothetical protein ACFL0W_01645 [Nanoarchaeota archaeon]
MTNKVTTTALSLLLASYLSSCNIVNIKADSDVKNSGGSIAGSLEKTLDLGTSWENLVNGSKVYEIRNYVHFQAELSEMSGSADSENMRFSEIGVFNNKYQGTYDVLIKSRYGARMHITYGKDSEKLTRVAYWEPNARVPTQIIHGDYHNQPEKIKRLFDALGAGQDQGVMFSDARGSLTNVDGWCEDVLDLGSHPDASRIFFDFETGIVTVECKTNDYDGLDNAVDSNAVGFYDFDKGPVLNVSSRPGVVQKTIADLAGKYGSVMGDSHLSRFNGFVSAIDNKLKEQAPFNKRYDRKPRTYDRNGK